MLIAYPARCQKRLDWCFDLVDTEVDGAVDVALSDAILAHADEAVDGGGQWSTWLVAVIGVGATSAGVVGGYIVGRFARR